MQVQREPEHLEQNQRQSPRHTNTVRERRTRLRARTPAQNYRHATKLPWTSPLTELYLCRGQFPAGCYDGASPARERAITERACAQRGVEPHNRTSEEVWLFSPEKYP